MKRNGKTKAGSQRWRCKRCGSSCTHTNDVAARDLDAFLGWLLSKRSQRDMPGQGRSFRRRAAPFWEVWPMPRVVDEVHKAVHVDGIWVARDVVVLIACTDDFVLGWHLARSENSRAWRALLSRIAPPAMVVTDGGTGFAKAVREEWPTTKVQRCIVHASRQVRRYTTSRPNLLAGVELLGLARDLLAVDSPARARIWVEHYLQWCEFWCDFLDERSIVDGRRRYAHERLRKAKSSLDRLVSSGNLFTFLDPGLAAFGPLPSTNNVIEGAVNSQLRNMLREHRGMSTARRVKAVFWWCHVHTECPASPREVLETMPKDADIDRLRKAFASNPSKGEGSPGWGDVPVFEEFHTRGRYPY